MIAQLDLEKMVGKQTLDGIKRTFPDPCLWGSNLDCFFHRLFSGGPLTFIALGLVVVAIISFINNRPEKTP